MLHCFVKTCQRVAIVDTGRRAIIKTLSEDLRTALLIVVEGGRGPASRRKPFKIMPFCFNGTIKVAFLRVSRGSSCENTYIGGAR